MNWFLTTMLCVVLVECFVRLPLRPVLTVIQRTLHKATHTVASNAISDHWKEKAMRAYAGTMFLSTIKLAAFLSVVIGIAALLASLLDLAGTGFFSFLLGWQGIVFSIVAASAYAVLRGRLV